MNDLHKIFSKSQTAKLIETGFPSLYDFISYLPTKLQFIEPLTFGANINNDSRYIFNGKIVNYDVRGKGKKFYQLTIEGKSQIIKAYLFISHPFLYQLLNLKTELQFLLRKNNEFWSIEKLAELQKTNKNLNKSETGNLTNKFVIGKADLQKYLLPIYSKVGQLSSANFITLHQKIPAHLYNLDLKGLVPENSLIPKIINLNKIHHPAKTEEFHETIIKWKLFKVFLYLCLVNFTNRVDNKTLGKKASLDIEFLKKLSASLQFELSMSQKQAVWELLQNISSVN